MNSNEQLETPSGEMMKQTGLSKTATLFVILVVGLLGAQVLYAQGWVLEAMSASYVGGFFRIWITWVFISVLLGFAGSYEILRTGRFNNPLMNFYLLLMIPEIGTAGWTMHSPRCPTQFTSDMTRSNSG